MIEQGHLSPFKIKAILLKYSDISRQYTKGFEYRKEIEWLFASSARNKFIRNLALSISGNTLILFQRVDSHGKLLYNDISNFAKGRAVHYIHGGVDGDEREEIRSLLETVDNDILVASYGTLSTGVNIKNLHNIIFAAPSKSKIRVMQSIGRGLRKLESKKMTTLFDIGDDLSWKKHKNYTLSHFQERINMYASESFPFKMYSVDLKE